MTILAILVILFVANIPSLILIIFRTKNWKKLSLANLILSIILLTPLNIIYWLALIPLIIFTIKDFFKKNEPNI